MMKIFYSKMDILKSVNSMREKGKNDTRKKHASMIV